MSPRPYLERETRLLAEWALATFPAAHVRTRVRLGALDSSLDDSHLTEAELRALGVHRRWVDMLVIEPDLLHLVEGKIVSTPGALEQLDLYQLLLPHTPELTELRSLAVERDLVIAVEDPVVTALAEARGIKVHVYHPPWVDEYLAQLAANKRVTPEPRGLQHDLGLKP